MQKLRTGSKLVWQISIIFSFLSIFLSLFNIVSYKHCRTFQFILILIFTLNRVYSLTPDKDNLRVKVRVFPRETQKPVINFLNTSLLHLIRKISFILISFLTPILFTLSIILFCVGYFWLTKIVERFLIVFKKNKYKQAYPNRHWHISGPPERDLIMQNNSDYFSKRDIE